MKARYGKPLSEHAEMIQIHASFFAGSIIALGSFMNKLIRGSR
jgi:hypothetical protein